MDFQTMQQELATPLGLPADSTRLLAERKLWLNRAYREILAKFDWPNSYESVFQTTEAEDDGTVTVSKGSTALTVSGATWTATAGGATERRQLKVGNLVFDLTAVATGGATLAKAAPAAISAESYVLFQAKYDLPASVGDITAAWIDGYAPLTVIRHPEASRRLGLDHSVGAPPCYLHRIGYDAEGDLIVRVHGYPLAIYDVHYKYEARITDLSGDTDVPALLPVDAHFLIPLKAEVHLQRFQGEASDVKQARDAFYDAWAEFQVKFAEPLGFELEPEIFRQDGGL